MREAQEWIEADGLGGFASGTAAGIRTRRYHALLLAADTPPTGRHVLVNGVECWVQTPTGSVALSSQRYAPDVVHPDGVSRIVEFAHEPWPRWTYRLDDGTEIEHEIIATYGAPSVLLRWTLRGTSPGITLFVRPLLSGRDTHALHRENASFRFEPQARGSELLWTPYDGVPQIAIQTNGTYSHDPQWYRNFLYTEEAARGLDSIEDLATPGVFAFTLSPRPNDAAAEALVLLSARGEASGGGNSSGRSDAQETVEVSARRLRLTEERRRQRFPSALHRAADAYIVRRGNGKTIVAGYPWFSDWGRDTFIALRGLAIASDRLDDARRILLEWAGAVSRGMLPNFFPESGQAAEFNAVDASLWYIVAVHELREALDRNGSRLEDDEESALDRAVQQILSGYAGGTRFGIHLDDDGLLAAGEPGVQLTWMDAKVGDWVVTPRIGKPVEVQALWINALRIGAASEPRWRALHTQALASFTTRFWDEGRGTLADVVDVDHVRGRIDVSVRPNQIFAVGGLPYSMLRGAAARAVVDAVEQHLLTPLGLRSLAPGEAGYAARYEGGVLQRDGSYHQGTVWPWLIGPFVEAWLRVHGDSPASRQVARQRFLVPLLAHLEDAGLGHVSEIADAEFPHTPRGCPFQAWSVGELLRLSDRILSESGSAQFSELEATAAI